MLSTIKKLLQSIALVPSVLALSFLILATLLLIIEVDYKTLPIFKAVVIEEKKDIQFILSFIIGGIFTLTIFSYTMVMNVLNRNINNYSPRLIPLLLSEKHHQIILGFTSGTIIYAMVLSINISSPYANYFPSIGAGLGVVFSIICVFMFIYFIHSVSQSIHINYILKQVAKRSKQNNIDQDKTHSRSKEYLETEGLEYTYKSSEEGYLHQPNYSKLLGICNKNVIKLHILKCPGQFVYTDDIIFSYSQLPDNFDLEKIAKCFAIDENVPLDVPTIEFKHLVEVAVKASSPAINDPGTSETAIRYLVQLFNIRKDYQYLNFNRLKLTEDVSRSNISNQALYKICFDEMEHYMKNDPYLSELLEAAKRKISINNTDLN